MTVGPHSAGCTNCDAHKFHDSPLLKLTGPGNTLKRPGEAASHRATSLRARRFGSKADIVLGPNDVRFIPRSGHWNSVVECPLCANSGHSAVRRKQPYSIT